MTNETINQFEDVSRIFKGFLTIVDGTTNKRLDQLLELSISAEVIVVPHYSSLKKKNNAVIGQTSKAIITFDDTKDLYDKFDEDNPDADTISNITKKINNELETVPFIFESVQETDSSDDDKFILYKFNGDITRSTLVRNTSSGTYEGELELDITSETHHGTSENAPT